jgi:hypothetical protein
MPRKHSSQELATVTMIIHLTSHLGIYMEGGIKPRRLRAGVRIPGFALRSDRVFPCVHQIRPI